MSKNGSLVVMIVVFSFCFLFCHSYTPDDNDFFDTKCVPGIWKNGKWTRLGNPYGNYYGRISRALVMK